MCTITQNIKFCTCSASQPENLNRYWVIYRYDGKKEYNIMGEPIMPYEDQNFELNNDILLQRLTESDAFDKRISFKNKDVFELVLDCNTEHRKVFTFQYKKKGWQVMEYDPFYIMNKFDVFRYGKVKGGYENNISKLLNNNSE